MGKKKPGEAELKGCFGVQVVGIWKTSSYTPIFCKVATVHHVAAVRGKSMTILACWRV